MDELVFLFRLSAETWRSHWRLTRWGARSGHLNLMLVQTRIATVLVSQSTYLKLGVHYLLILFNFSLGCWNGFGKDFFWWGCLFRYFKDFSSARKWRWLYIYHVVYLTDTDHEISSGHFHTIDILGHCFETKEEPRLIPYNWPLSSSLS